MRLVLVAAIALGSCLAQASEYLTAKPSPALAEIVKNDKSLTNKIENAIKRETGAKALYGFRVVWDSLVCIAADASELSEQFGGVCTVTAGAMQVGGQIAIVKKANKAASVSVIWLDEE